ncbi:MAG: hypothetical protein NTW33_01935 [Methanoregula sp.]|nr:hypothetical protein [Methanoregula sp.]
MVVEQKQYKVIYIETESTNKKDVAEPDAVASGMAGTGQENEELEWARRHLPPDSVLC